MVFHQRRLTTFIIGSTWMFSYISAITSLQFHHHAGQVLLTDMVLVSWVSLLYPSIVSRKLPLKEKLTDLEVHVNIFIYDD